MQPWMFRVQVDNGLAHRRRQAAIGLSERIGHFGEEAQHLPLVKLVGFVAGGAFTGACLLGALGWGIPKEDHQAQ